MQLFSITFALHPAHSPSLTHTLALSLSARLPLSRSSPRLLCKVLRRTRTIIIKTKMFKIHFLFASPSPTHSFRSALSFVLRPCLPLLLLRCFPPPFARPRHYSCLARSHARHAKPKKRRNENEVALPVDNGSKRVK